MAWTAPVTAIAGATVTSADFNTYVRDNLSQTMPAKALNVGSMFMVSAANTLTERLSQFDHLSTSQTTASTSYTDLATAGPAVSVVTGTSAIVIVGALIGANTAAAGAPSNKMSWACSGATTVAASDLWATGVVQTGTGAGPSVYSSRWHLATGLNPGTNTFTTKYAVSSGTGTFALRAIQALPL